jgi:hypothetical protein
MVKWVAGVALLVFLSGCGGSGAPSAVVGEWAGTWNDPTTKHAGTLDITIQPDEAGTFTGNETDTTAGTQTPVSGTLSRHMNLQLWLAGVIGAGLPDWSGVTTVTVQALPGTGAPVLTPPTSKNVHVLVGPLTTGSKGAHNIIIVLTKVEPPF